MTDRYTLRTQRNLEKHFLVDVDAPSDLDEGFGKAVLFFMEADMTDASQCEGWVALAELLNGADGGGSVQRDRLCLSVRIGSHVESGVFVRRQRQ